MGQFKAVCKVYLMGRIGRWKVVRGSKLERSFNSFSHYYDEIFNN